MQRRNFLHIAGATVVATTLAGCTGEEEQPRKEGDANDGEQNVAGDSTKTETGPNETMSPTEASTGQKVDVLEDAFYADDYSFGVKGKAKNVSGETLDYVEFKTFFYDSEGTRVAEGLDNHTDVRADTTFTFDSMGMDNVDPETIEEYELQVSTSTY